MTLGGLNLLDFFDEVTNAVLMPVCAFFACLAIGWMIGPKTAMNEIEASGTPLGFLRRIWPVMVRFVTPALILIVEIGGVVEKISKGRWLVVLTAYLLLGAAALAYFLFFKNTDTGTNADEVEHTAAAE